MTTLTITKRPTLAALLQSPDAEKEKRVRELRKLKQSMTQAGAKPVSVTFPKLHCVVPKPVTTAFQRFSNHHSVCKKDLEGIHNCFLSRVQPISKPTIYHYTVTRAARTILRAPGGLAIALINRPSLGDREINNGGFKILHPGVGWPDGGLYAVGICDVASIALKKKKKPEIIRALLQREVTISKEIQGIAGIVPMPAAFESNGNFYFVMKFCPGGDLFQLERDLLFKTKHYSLLQRVTVAREILQPVAELHKQKIIYRDLKPENVLLDEEGHVLLCDFGLSTHDDDQGPLGIRNVSGTPSYLAPEVVRGEASTHKVDSWAAGMVFIHLFAGQWMHWESDKLTSAQKREEIPQDEAWEVPDLEIDEEIHDLIKNLMKVNPKDRLSILEALERLLKIEGRLKSAGVSPRVSEA